MSKSKKKKSSIIKDNKKELIILAILIVLALIAVLFERSYALDNELGNDSNTPAATENSTNDSVDGVEELTVTYVSDENGTVEDEIESKGYEENPSGRTPVPNEGYKFKYWTCDKEVTLTDGTTIELGSPITSEQVTQIKVTEDITLTAIHEENEQTITKYTVSYVDGNNPIEAPFEVDEGTKITLIELPEKEGYTPVEWKIDGTSYNPGSEVTITKDTTIEVVYTRDQTEKQSYTVIYKFDGTDIESTTVAEGSKIKIKALPTKTGCEVKKWTINGEEVSVGDEIEIAANTTIITTSICSSEDMKEESSKTENTTEEIVVEKEKSNVTPSSTESTKVNASRYKNSKVLNPKTGDRIMTYILIAGVSLIVIIALLIILNLKNKKEKKEDKENK